MKTKRTHEETLHMALDILVANYLQATGNLMSKTTIMDLMMWSGSRVIEQKESKPKKRKQK